jgi:hypothetical protein
LDSIDGVLVLAAPESVLAVDLLAAAVFAEPLVAVLFFAAVVLLAGPFAAGLFAAVREVDDFFVVGVAEALFNVDPFFAADVLVAGFFVVVFFVVRGYLVAAAHRPSQGSSTILAYLGFRCATPQATQPSPLRGLEARKLGAANRNRNDPGNRSNSIAFRCVRDVERRGFDLFEWRESAPSRPNRECLSTSGSRA